MKKGFDASRDLSKFASCLYLNGYTFVARYYNINNHSKNLTVAEAQILSKAGLGIVAVWENGFPTNPDYFTREKGIFDGNAAYSYANDYIKQPAGSPIYFTVDYDASSNDIDKNIIPYFQGIKEAFRLKNSDYFIGVYGSGLVCSSVLSVKLAKFSWLAQSKGWKGSKLFKSYNIEQSLQITECAKLGGIKGDPNESPNDYEGSFLLQVPV